MCKQFGTMHHFCVSSDFDVHMMVMPFGRLE
jgi:hypothetical protein